MDMYGVCFKGSLVPLFDLKPFLAQRALANDWAQGTHTHTPVWVASCSCASGMRPELSRSWDAFWSFTRKCQVFCNWGCFFCLELGMASIFSVLDSSSWPFLSPWKTNKNQTPVHLSTIVTGTVVPPELESVLCRLHCFELMRGYTQQKTFRENHAGFQNKQIRMIGGHCTWETNTNWLVPSLWLASKSSGEFSWKLSGVFAETLTWLFLRAIYHWKSRL